MFLPILVHYLVEMYAVALIFQILNSFDSQTVSKLVIKNILQLGACFFDHVIQETPSNTQIKWARMLSCLSVRIS